jgi:hypothetical protein
MAPALGFSIPPIVTWECSFAQAKNVSADKKNNLIVFIARKLKHTVNKVPSLRDFVRRSGEKNNLAVFIDFYFYCF